MPAPYLVQSTIKVVWKTRLSRAYMSHPNWHPLLHAEAAFFSNSLNRRQFSPDTRVMSFPGKTRALRRRVAAVGGI